MTSFRATPEQIEIEKRLDAMLDFTSFRGLGAVRQLGKQLRAVNGMSLHPELAHRLVNAGIYDAYVMPLSQLMPLIEVLWRVAPELRDNNELAEMWSVGKTGQYVLAYICVACINTPDVADQIIASMALLDMKGPTYK